MDRLGGLVVIAPVRRAGDPGSNPGPGENFSLKLLVAVGFHYKLVATPNSSRYTGGKIAFTRL